jgi:hypothetical protein
VSPFDDDGREPPHRANSGRTPEDRAPTPPRRPRRPPPAPRAESRPRARPPLTAPTTSAQPRPQPRPTQSGEDLWAEHFDEGIDDGEPVPPDASRRRHAASGTGDQDDRRRRRRRTILALAIVLLPIVLVLAAGGWFLYQLNPPGSPGKQIGIDIPRRTGNGEIGDLLEDTGIIGSSRAFQIYIGVTRAGPFESGHYTMREDLGVRDAVDVLKSGPEKTPEFRLLLPRRRAAWPQPRRLPRRRAVGRRAFEVPASGGDVARRAPVPRHVLHRRERDR